MQRFEAAFDRSRSQDSPSPDRTSYPLQFLGAEVVQVEKIAEQFSRALGDDNHVRLGNALEARCEVWGLADDRLLLGRSSPNQVADD
jgi:hypothetical protein